MESILSERVTKAIEGANQSVDILIQLINDLVTENNNLRQENARLSNNDMLSVDVKKIVKNLTDENACT